MNRYGLIDIFGGFIETDREGKYTKSCDTGDYILYADHDEAMNNAVREISDLVAENKKLKEQHEAIWRECERLAKRIKKLEGALVGLMQDGYDHWYPSVSMKDEDYPQTMRVLKAATAALKEGE